MSDTGLFQAVFLDRDGVINEEAGIVRSLDQLQLIPGSARAIARLNAIEVPVIVITNQPVVARGWATESDVDRMHDYLRDLLGAEGAVIDAVYFCPHHENANDPAYRKICDCRKPRPGLLLRAVADFRLDPGRCVMIGDRTVDLEAGKQAGCSSYLVKTGYGGSDGKCATRPDREFENLSAAVDYICGIE